MKTYTRFIIERKTSFPEWEVVAHPKNDIEEAKRVLLLLREEEKRRTHTKPLRLIRETREHFDV